jgi:DNA mismatch repair protein MutL
LLLSGRFPIAFLRLEMPAEAVDVNIHPTKLEVRFADSGRIYSLLLGTIRKKFLATDLTARVRAPVGAAEPGADAADAAAVLQHRRELVDWAKGALAGELHKRPAEPRLPRPTRMHRRCWSCVSNVPLARRWS